MTILTIVFPPMGGGGVLRMAKLAKYLPELGWDVTVVRSSGTFWELDDPALSDEIPAGVQVRTVGGPIRTLGSRANHAGDAGSSGRPGALRAATRAAKAAVRSVLIPDRYLGWAWRVSRLDRSELGDPDVLLSSGPPHSVHLAATSLAGRHGIPMVMDLRDNWSDNPMHANPAPWHRPIERRLEARCVQHASRVVHASEMECEVLRGRYPRLHGFEAIDNGFDPADLAGLPARVPAAPGDPVRFLYAGSLRGPQDVGAFLEVFGDMAKHEPGRLRLDLLGPIGPRFRSLATTAIGGNAVGISDAVPHAEALRAMSAADVLLVFTGGGGIGVNTMTGKLYECIALRRPIMLIGPEGPAADLVRSSGAGVVADPDDAPGLRAAIQRAAELARDPSFTGAPDQVLARFDRRRLAERWSALLAEVVAAGPVR